MDVFESHAKNMCSNLVKHTLDEHFIKKLFQNLHFFMSVKSFYQMCFYNDF